MEMQAPSRPIVPPRGVGQRSSQISMPTSTFPARVHMAPRFKPNFFPRPHRHICMSTQNCSSQEMHYYFVPTLSFSTSMKKQICCLISVQVGCGSSHIKLSFK
jgi:hypothetical protein